MAPTNILRETSAAGAANKPKRRRGSGGARVILIHVGKVAFHARLLATPTADRILSALPLYGTAERWGDSVHFEIPIKSGREAAARWNVKAGEIAFWSDDDRIIIGFGPTPLSKPSEIRMPSPANIWAVTDADVSQLSQVIGGERVAVLLADS